MRTKIVTFVMGLVIFVAFALVLYGVSTDNLRVVDASEIQKYYDGNVVCYIYLKQAISCLIP